MRTTAALCAILVAHAGCSAPGDQGERKPADGLRITFGEISTAASHTPLYAAVGEGFFRRAGLHVSLQALTGGTPSAMAAMATGNIDMMMSGSTEFIEYSAKKVIAGKIIGELQDSTFDVVVSKGIAGIPQLKGKVLGISGLNGGDQLYLEAVLQHYGVSARDVTYVTTGNATNRLTALSTGAIQAIAASNSNREMSEKVGSVLLKSGDSPVKIPTSMIFASSELVAKHKPALQNFLKALGEATAWVKANPEDAARYCMNGSGAGHDDCLASIKALSDPALAGKFTWSSSAAINTAGMQTAFLLWASLNPGMPEFKLADLVDASFAQATP